jgi:hypothetical protein
MAWRCWYLSEDFLIYIRVVIPVFHFVKSMRKIVLLEMSFLIEIRFKFRSSFTRDIFDLCINCVWKIHDLRFRNQLLGMWFFFHTRVSWRFLKEPERGRGDEWFLQIGMSAFPFLRVSFFRKPRTRLKNYCCAFSDTLGSEYNLSFIL